MKRLSRLLVPALAALAPLAASAAFKLLPDCTANGNCGITDILVVFVNLAEYLLGISGAVALAYFVYGGFVFVLSRGNKGEVDRAFGILRSAAIGVAVIFCSGVLIRFSIQALTGGQSAIPTIGESCSSVGNRSNPSGDGLWISMPAGFTDPSNPTGSAIQEGLWCAAKDNCQSLNTELERRHRPERYTCIPTDQGRGCVRGLCPASGADSACCLK